VVDRDQAVMAAAGQPLQRGRADLGTVEGGRQLRSHLAGSGMLASHQRASALEGGPVQILDNQHQDALLTRRSLSDCATVTACPAGPRFQMGLLFAA
jgi:hypothetical protein